MADGLCAGKGSREGGCSLRHQEMADHFPTHEPKQSKQESTIQPEILAGIKFGNWVPILPN